MAAMFFWGVFSTFMAYSQIGGSAGSASPGPQGQPPGSQGDGGGGGAHMPPQHSVNRADSATGQVAMPKINDVTPASPGQRGNAVPNGS
jgi:type IV secretion system protein VirB6